MSTADKKRVNIETPVYGSTAMAAPAPTDTIPMEPTSPEIVSVGAGDAIAVEP